VKRAGWIIGILAAVGLAVAFAVMRGTTQASAKVAVGRTVKVTRGEVATTVSESGVLEPVTQIEVKSQVAGRLKRIFVKEGDRVEKGALIALIDPVEVARNVERIKAQLAAARASYRQAQENYDLAIRQNAVAIRRAENNLKEAERRYQQASAPTRPQDVRQAEFNVEASTAAVTQAEGQVEQAKAQVAQINAQIKQLEASLARVDAQIVDNKRNVERQKKLLADGFVSQQAVDTAQTQLNVSEADRASAEANIASARANLQSVKAAVPNAEAGLRSAKANLASAKQRLSLQREGPRAEDIAPARAAVDTAQAQVRKRDVERAAAEIKQIENQLAQQSVQLTETRIVAPITGEITGKYVNEGELVASATAGFAQGAVLVRVADLSLMQVRVNINEVDVTRLRRGLPVEIRVDGVPKQVFEGEITSIAPASLTASQTGAAASSTAVVRFEVKIRVKSPDARLRPGMTAAARIVIEKKENILSLPGEALQAGDKVTVVTGAGETLKKEDRVVKVGARGNATVEIVDGLKDGDTVEVPKVDAKDRRKVNFGPDGN
jgi:HlyD family secretion protein